MKQVLLNRAGSAIGLIGLATCITGLLARAGGHYYMMGFETGTIFVGGIALIATACFAKLEVLVSRVDT